MSSFTISPGATIISGPHGAIKRLSAIASSFKRLFRSDIHEDLEEYLLSKNIQNAAEADFYIRQFEQHKFNQRFF